MLQKNARESKYREPLAWLESAGLVYLNYQTSDVESPLMANKNGKFFKVYMCDTGLMFYKYGLDPIAFIDKNLRMYLASRFRSAIAENYVKQALEANNFNTFYWAGGTGSQTEVEFVSQNSYREAIPIEVKSGENVRSRSFNYFIRKSNPKLAIKISAKNFGYKNNIFSIPLYSVFCVTPKFLNEI